MHKFYVSVLWCFLFYFVGYAQLTPSNLTIFDGRALQLSKYTVSPDGMLIKDAFPGVDKMIVYKANVVNTDYLVRQPLNTSGELVISEEIILPAGYTITEINLGDVFNIGKNVKEYVVMNAEGIVHSTFKVPRCYDSNPYEDAETTHYPKHNLRNEGGKIFLDVVIAEEWINDTERVYPLTISTPSSIQYAQQLIKENPEQGSVHLRVYPNPLEIHSVLEFRVSDAAYTTVDIYNIKGAFISRLFDNTAKEATEYRVNISGLSSGMYIARLQSGDLVKHQMLIVN